MNSYLQKMINKLKIRQVAYSRWQGHALCVGALALLSYSQVTVAITVCNAPQPIVLNFSPMVYEGGADGPAIGQPIGSGWGAVTHSPNYLNGDSNCYITSGLILPMLGGAISGVTYTEGALTYPVFATGVPSIGIVLGIKPTQAANYIPVDTYLDFPPIPNPSYGLGVDVQAKLVVIGRLASGFYPIAQRNIARLYANGILPGTGETTTTGYNYLVLGATSVTITAKTCSLVGGTMRNVPLPSVGKNQFSGVGSISSAGYDLTLTTLCDNGVKVYATMTDATDAGNTGNILKPAEGTTASGVGVQILYNNQPIAFGPDSSAIGNTNQWYAGTAQSGGPVNIPLHVRYVQTANDMQAGRVNARATVTFSYQ